MTYSEKTQRALDKYTRVLVRRQPGWLRKLFETGEVWFGLDGGFLQMYCKDLDPVVKDRASRLVSNYLEKHPTPSIRVLEVQ